jgi:hypothetical protein
MAWPTDFVDGNTLTAASLNGWVSAIKAWGGDVDTGGYSIKLESSAPVDVDIPNRGLVIWIDEAANKLKFRLRYAAGTLKSGEISLT